MEKTNNEKKEKIDARKKFRKIFFVSIVLISAITALISMEYGKTVTDNKNSLNRNKTLKDFTYEQSSKADFATFEDGIFYFTKDGVQYLNQDGEVLWNNTYNMTIPYMVQNQGIVGVSEHKGRLLNIYNKKGLLYSVTLENPIISFSLSANGFSSVITSNKSQYLLDVFNLKSEKIFSGSFQMLQGIPITSAISPDGNTLAIGFLKIGEMNIGSRISFYNINPENTKKGETNDAVFASYDESLAVCGSINFFDNNFVSVVSDKNIRFLNVKPLENEKFKEIAKVDFKNQIRQVAFDTNSNIYVAYGEKLMNSGKDALPTGTVEVYDKNGTLKTQISTDKKVSGIYPTEESFVIGLDRHFKNYDLSGNLLWEYNTGQDTKKVLLLDDKDLILFVGTNSASILRVFDQENIIEVEDEEKEQTTEQQSSETTTVQQTTQKQTEKQQPTENTTEQKQQDNIEHKEEQTTSKPKKEQNNDKKTEPTTQKTEVVTEKTEPITSNNNTNVISDIVVETPETNQEKATTKTETPNNETPQAPHQEEPDILQTPQESVPPNDNNSALPEQ